MSPTRFCMNISSVQSAFMERGKVSAAMLSMVLMASPVLVPVLMLPLTEAAA